MDRQALTDPDPVHPIGESRARVLHLLRAAPAPLGVQEVASQAGLHPNTARFHLDGLVTAGLARRQPEERDQPGRPRTVYRATPSDVVAGRRSYRLLAEILTSLLAGVLPEPSDAAVEAGRAWGRYLTDRPAPFTRLTTEQVLDRLMDVLGDVGFTVDPSSADTEIELRIRHCPFREVAESHRDIICPMHLGLIQGALAEMRAPVIADRIEPFVEASLCLARLRPAPVPPPEPTAGATGGG